MSECPLRTRIACTIHDATEALTMSDCMALSDALIREFDLRIERVIDGHLMWSDDRHGDETPHGRHVRAARPLVDEGWWRVVSGNWWPDVVPPRPDGGRQC